MPKVICSVCGCACDEAVDRSCPECGDCVCDDCGVLYEGCCQGCFEAAMQKFE